MLKTQKMKPIHEKVSKIIERLENENTKKIDKNVVYQIRAFLGPISIEIENISKCTEDEKNDMKKLVEKAFNSLEKANTVEGVNITNFKITGTDKDNRQKQVEEVANYVKGLKAKVKTNQLEPDEYEKSMNTTIEYYQQIDKFPKSFTDKDIDEVKRDISALVVDLFLGMAIAKSDGDTTVRKSQVPSDYFVGNNIPAPQGTGSSKNKNKTDIPDDKNVCDQKEQSPQNLKPKENTQKIASRYHKHEQEKSKEITEEKTKHVSENKTKSETKRSNAIEKKADVSSSYRRIRSTLEKLEGSLSDEEYQRIGNEVIALPKNSLNAEEKEDLEYILDQLEKISTKQVLKKTTTDPLRTKSTIKTKKLKNDTNKNKVSNQTKIEEQLLKETVTDTIDTKEKVETSQKVCSFNSNIKERQEESLEHENINGTQTTEVAEFSQNNFNHLEENQEFSPINDTESTAKSSENAVKIIDLQPHLVDSQFDDITIPKYSMEFLEEVRRRAEAFEGKVEQYKGPEGSVDYFIIDENLMRFIEELDKIKCHNDKTMNSKKTEIINYIHKLLNQLEANTNNGLGTRVYEKNNENALY